ncbi:carbohydrate ABC transporter permease [Tengunoibacter tsumagoiensis]|uniref:Spermidine/putrescine ABC transporter permease n=1 Tax=Tengunoibacter tsumagoiensis TaxID=2014871 RepID=A0A402A776_9CHLR|nr:sugar ABC transporter permease [Tengunoibacter tsumagoiensis]GCE14886.1 spermidine/putrescine ABC transporter permease [Tengunoibacter tsumagoiensis]
MHMSIPDDQRRGSLRGPARSQTLWQRFWKFLRSRDARGYFYIAPWVIGYVLFNIYPLLRTIYLSFTDYNLFLDPKWIGLKNYQQIFFHDTIFRTVLTNMLFYVTISTVMTIVLGLLFAVLLARNFPGNYLFRTIFYVPSLMVGISIATLFGQVFRSGEVGLANSMLGWVHLAPFNWLHSNTSPLLALVAVLLVDFWFIGGNMLIFLSGIRGINPEFYEAARIDSANAWQRFIHVTLPLLSPVIVFNVITNLIWHLQAFEIPLVFASNAGSLSTGQTLGDNNRLATFLTYIYTKSFIFGQFGYGAALSVIVFAITLVLTLIVLWIASRYTVYGD